MTTIGSTQSPAEVAAAQAIAAALGGLPAVVKQLNDAREARLSSNAAIAGALNAMAAEFVDPAQQPVAQQPLAQQPVAQQPLAQQPASPAKRPWYKELLEGMKLH